MAGEKYENLERLDTKKDTEWQGSMNQWIKKYRK